MFFEVWMQLNDEVDGWDRADGISSAIISWTGDQLPSWSPTVVTFMIWRRHVGLTVPCW